MDSEERVELDLSTSDNDKLLLRYGPVAKAKSYATTHYSYILGGIHSRHFDSKEEGTILLDMSMDWKDVQKDERITLEEDCYCIKLYGFQSSANRIERMLYLPGVKVQQASNEVGQEGPSGESETNEKWVVKIPRSYEYDEWFDKISWIKQARVSSRLTKKGRGSR